MGKTAKTKPLSGSTAQELVDALAARGLEARINVVVLKDGVAEGIFYTEGEAARWIRRNRRGSEDLVKATAALG